MVRETSRTIEIQAGRQTITAADPSPTTSAGPSTPSSAAAEVRTSLSQLGFVSNVSGCCSSRTEKFEVSVDVWGTDPPRLGKDTTKLVENRAV
jgi:hypothetical protein